MKCDGCTECCKLGIKEFKKPVGKYCDYFDLETKLCTIYSTRPEECRNFKCIYSQMKKCSINFRPDICGVIFEKISERIIIGTFDDLHEINSMILDQMRYFSNEGYSVVLFNKNIEGPFIYLAKEHDLNEIINEIDLKAIDRIW